MFIKTEMLVRGRLSSIFGNHVSVMEIFHVQDTIGIEPRDQGLDPAEVLEREINRKYANKVGLCNSLVCLQRR